MSQTMNCPFCGKELTKGSFGLGKNTRKLSIWSIDLICCTECYDKYDDFTSKDTNRFYEKLENLIYDEQIDFPITNYFTQEEIAELFLQYYEESKQYHLNRGYTKLFTGTPDELGVVNCAVLTDEIGILDWDSPSTIADTSTDLMKAEEERIHNGIAKFGASTPRTAWPFTSEDFTCFEYAFKDQEDVGEYIALSIVIKLNNIRRMTYRPCLIHGVIVFPNYMLASHIEECVENFMIDLRRRWGIEHLPIVRKTEAELRDKIERRTERITPMGTWEKIKKTAEKVWDKIVDIYDAFQEKIRILRIIACFTALASTVAGFLVFFVPSADSVLIGAFGLIGMVSTLIACPLHMLGLILNCLLFCLKGGIFFGFAGLLITVVVAMIVVLFLPAIITIPYCFAELIYERNGES